MQVSDYQGLGIRLTRQEMRRLDSLARATGRSKNGVIRALVRLAQPRDLDMLAIIRQEQTKLEAEDATF